jgi:triacylglycerol lipase
MVSFDKQKPPIPGWGTGELTVDKWQENDGAVSSISQRYPFTAGNHPLGGEGFLGGETIEKGKWYFERAEKSTGRSFDHLDVVFGYKSELSGDMVEPHKTLYRNINELLCKLP